MEHKLKIMSKYYEAILSGKKTFEVRNDDRPYRQGDTLLLQETVTPYGCGYTGREMKVEVTYILRDSDYVKAGYCIMGIKIISTNKARYYGNKPINRIEAEVTDVQPVIHAEAKRTGGLKMTIDEAIQYFEKTADYLEERKLKYEINNTYIPARKVDCLKCATEYRQIAEWLKEAKQHGSH